MPALSREDVIMGQFLKISTANAHEYWTRMDTNREWTRMDANRRGRWVEATLETFPWVRSRE